MPVIGPTVVARSAIEIASGAWWLMEPGIGARRRVCRELALSVRSARRARQVAEEFRSTGFPVSQEITEALQLEARVLRQITDYGITPPASAGSSPVIESERARPATEVTAEMLKAVLPGSVPGTSFYRTYSAVTHGEFYGLMNFMDPETPADGSTLLSWQLPPELLDRTVQMAIAAFGQASKQINRVMGWGKLEHDLWRSTYRRSTTGQESPANEPCMLLTPYPCANRDDVPGKARTVQRPAPAAGKAAS